MSNEGRREALAAICRRFNIDILYAFGSRGREALAWLNGDADKLSSGRSDLDVGAKPAAGVALTVQDKVRLAIALEDLFDVGRVDLVSLPESDPFLAANVIRGERLYSRDDYLADEYDLYILRRAGDLAYLERERIALILDKKP